MQLEYAFLAESASIGDGGATLSAQRIGLAQISLPALPAMSPSFCVVLSVRFTPDEWDSDNALALHLVDPDGMLAAPPWEWRIRPAAVGAQAAAAFLANHVMRFESVAFRCPGRYECRILLDGAEAKALLLDVVRGDHASPSHADTGVSARP